MSGRYALLVCVLLGGAGLGCAPSDVVIVDKMESVADGAGIFYKLEPGRYEVDVTASNDGVTVKFIGCSCPGTEKETQTFSTICELTQTGQVTIDNPTVFGGGAGSTGTVKIKRVGRT